MNHRSKTAEKKRLMMRTKLIDAACRVFADHTRPMPVVDDIIREAKVSRGSFYNYFDSLEQVLAVVGLEFSNQMMTDILPVYDVLTEPWQRVSVAFRLYLVRALLDRKWAGFMLRPDAWTHHALAVKYMTSDLESGRRLGQFCFDDINAADDVVMGAAIQAMRSIRQGMDDPNTYMNACARMVLTSLGCQRELADKALAFSLNYLQDWACGRLGIIKPLWALNMNSPEGQRFLCFSPPA
jgi:AcrR family transcriptional regulator